MLVNVFWIIFFYNLTADISFFGIPTIVLAIAPFVLTHLLQWTLVRSCARFFAWYEAKKLFLLWIAFLFFMWLSLVALQFYFAVWLVVCFVVLKAIGNTFFWVSAHYVNVTVTSHSERGRVLSYKEIIRNSVRVIVPVIWWILWTKFGIVGLGMCMGVLFGVAAIVISHLHEYRLPEPHHDDLHPVEQARIEKTIIMLNCCRTTQVAITNYIWPLFIAIGLSISLDSMWLLLWGSLMIVAVSNYFIGKKIDAEGREWWSRKMFVLSPFVNTSRIIPFNFLSLLGVDIIFRVKDWIEDFVLKVIEWDLVGDNHDNHVVFHNVILQETVINLCRWVMLVFFALLVSQVGYRFTILCGSVCTTLLFWLFRRYYLEVVNGEYDIREHVPRGQLAEIAWE